MQDVEQMQLQGHVIMSIVLPVTQQLIPIASRILAVESIISAVTMEAAGSGEQQNHQKSALIKSIMIVTGNVITTVLFALTEILLAQLQ